MDYRGICFIMKNNNVKTGPILVYGCLLLKYISVAFPGVYVKRRQKCDASTPLQDMNQNWSVQVFGNK